MAYDAQYVVRADVEAELDAASFLSALNDTGANPPAETPGLWDKLAANVDAEVAGTVALIQTMGREVPPSAFLRLYAKIAMCALLYRRRGLAGERNPYEEREKALREKLDAIANGEVKDGSFAHLSIDDAEPNIFMDDSEASSGSGGGGGGAGVSSLNGETGAVTISAGNNITVTTDGGDIRIDGEGGGVESVNTLTGAVTIAAGTGISVTPGEENELTIANTQTPTTVNGKSGAVTLTPGSGISITETQGGNGVTIANSLDAVAAIEAADLSTLTLNGSTITEWPEGGGAETARVVTTATATVEDGDGLILMDTATAGQAQTLTLPASLEADAATVTVRQLGGYGVTITGPTDDYELTYAGDWVTLDWIAGKGWFWRA